MRPEKVPEKVTYLNEKLGITLPSEWYDEQQPGAILTDFLACVHVAYTFASKLPILRSIGEYTDQLVSEEEMLQIVTMFREKYQQR